MLKVLWNWTIKKLKKTRRKKKKLKKNLINDADNDTDKTTQSNNKDSKRLEQLQEHNLSNATPTNEAGFESSILILENNQNEEESIQKQFQNETNNKTNTTAAVTGKEPFGDGIESSNKDSYIRRCLSEPFTVTNNNNYSHQQKIATTNLAPSFPTLKSISSYKSIDSNTTTSSTGRRERLNQQPYYTRKYGRSNSLTISATTVEVNDFIKLKLIGKGDVGKVYLVRSVKDHSLYAMKILNKKVTLREKIMARIQSIIIIKIRAIDFILMRF